MLYSTKTLLKLIILEVFSVITYQEIGPSGVHALPLAAGIDEGGHYFRYFANLSQAQAQE